MIERLASFGPDKLRSKFEPFVWAWGIARDGGRMSVNDRLIGLGCSGTRTWAQSRVRDPSARRLPSLGLVGRRERERRRLIKQGHRLFKDPVQIGYPYHRPTEHPTESVSRKQGPLPSKEWVRPIRQVNKTKLAMEEAALTEWSYSHGFIANIAFQNVSRSSNVRAIGEYVAGMPS